MVVVVVGNVVVVGGRVVVEVVVVEGRVVVVVGLVVLVVVAGGEVDGGGDDVVATGSTTSGVGSGATVSGGAVSGAVSPSTEPSTAEPGTIVLVTGAVEPVLVVSPATETVVAADPSIRVDSDPPPVELKTARSARTRPLTAARVIKMTRAKSLIGSPAPATNPRLILTEDASQMRFQPRIRPDHLERLTTAESEIS